MPLFTSNYPSPDSLQVGLLSTPERTGAPPQYTGRGVVIAFIDSGFYPHPDLGDRILVHVDATTQRIVEQQHFRQSELSWHGQMTTVIAAGDGRMSDGRYRGIASDARLVLIKVSNSRGQVKEADILRGMRWLVAAHRRFNVRILNISVGGDHESHDPEHPLHHAVRELVEAGVVVMVAAGNRGKPPVVPPASSPDAITVGGVDDRNSLDRSHWALYPGSYGVAYDNTPKPDLLAPAAWVASPFLPDSPIALEARWLAPLLQAQDISMVSQLLRETWVNLGLMDMRFDDNLLVLLQQRIHAHKIVDAHHQHVDGTSVSTAIASSVVAQMLEANPRLTPQQIRAILATTAQPLSGVPRERQGAGVIRAAAAVEAALRDAS